jgi:hypothetical protein
MTALYNTLSEQQKREIRMYGCTVEQMREAVEQSITYRFSGAGMYVASLLSDAQEMVAYDNGGQYDMMLIEDQRQLLNRAKWVMFEYVIQQDGSVVAPMRG